MLDQDEILATFRQALSSLGPELRAKDLRPREIALRAHQIYCAALEPDEKRPAFETFRKFTTGKSALPDVVQLLRSAKVRRSVRVSLDRHRLRAVFQEAVQRLENRLLHGRARPLQIARRAHQLYTREIRDAAIQPSYATFERLIYGKAADPEILTLIKSALPSKKIKKD